MLLHQLSTPFSLRIPSHFIRVPVILNTDETFQSLTTAFLSIYPRRAGPGRAGASSAIALTARYREGAEGRQKPSRVVLLILSLQLAAGCPNVTKDINLHRTVLPSRLGRRHHQTTPNRRRQYSLAAVVRRLITANTEHL